MGWWEQNREGESVAQNDGPAMVWGDGPADLFDDALAAIVREFETDQGRKPTLDEIRAGLEFSLSGFADDAPRLSVVPS